MMEMSSKHVLEQAICNGLRYYDEPQYIVFNANHELELETIEPVGKIVVMTVTFARKDTEDFLKKVNPELIPELDNGYWKTGYWDMMHDDDSLTKFPETEPAEMIRLQNRLDDRIAEVRKAWGF